MNMTVCGLAKPGRKAWWRILRMPLLLGGSMAGGLLLAGLLGYRINFSASEPVGLWQILHISGCVMLFKLQTFMLPALHIEAQATRMTAYWTFLRRR